MIKDCLIKCPWCQGTGRKDYDGHASLYDNSTKIIPDENMCPKCSGRIDNNTTYGGGWIHINKLFIKGGVK